VFLTRAAESPARTALLTSEGEVIAPFGANLTRGRPVSQPSAESAARRGEGGSERKVSGLRERYARPYFRRE
jgi:hypothetical protein